MSVLSSSRRRSLALSWRLGQRRTFASKKSHKPDIRRSVYRPFEAQKPYHKEVVDASPENLMQSQMYTPEVQNSNGLAVNCHRMVLYGLSMPELLDRYGERAAELASGLTPLQFSLLLSAFARAEHRHEEMLNAFTKHIPPRLPNFLPMQLSQTCNAYAKLRERDEALFRRFSSEMPHKLPYFEGFQLKNVVNAYARLDIRDDLLFDDIADEIVRRPEELPAASLALVANAYGHFRINHARLWQTLADWLLRTYLDLRSVDIAMVLNAFSAVGVRHDALLSALLRYLTHPSLLDELEASSQGLTLNAVARLRWDGDGGHEEVIHALGDNALRRLDDFSAAGVTQLLNACVKLPATLGTHDAFIEGLLGRANCLVPEFSSQSISLLVHSCAKLRRRDVALLTRVAKVVPPQISDFTPQALAMLTQGYAKLEVRSEILFYLLAEEIVAKMPLFSGQGVAMVLRAFGRLKIQNDKLVRACKKQVRALADELTMKEVESIEAAFRGLDALDGSTEAFFRRVRKELGTSPLGDFNVGVAPTATTGRLDLLQRLAADEISYEPTGSRPISNDQPEAALRSEPSPVGRQPETTLGGSRPQPSSSEQPDLWELWADDSVFPDGSNAARVSEGADAGATAAADLRSYLARSERGVVSQRRRPVVRLEHGTSQPAPPDAVTATSIDNDVAASAASSGDRDRDDDALGASGIGRGRRGRMRTRQWRS